MKITNENNIELMARYEDNHFDLAIVDPPYGIGADITQEYYSANQKRISNNGKWKKYKKTNWDSSPPSVKYFNELLRVSYNQIVWGGNYFLQNLENTRCFLSWDKMQSFTGSDFELAWTSFDKASKVFRMTRIEAYSNNNNVIKDPFIKIHPTQKPIKLYEWILKNFAQKGDKIIDTHLGSGSIAVACYNYGFDLVGLEIDKEYYTKANKRLEHRKNTPTLF